MITAVLLSWTMMASAPEDIDAFFARFAEKRAGIQVLRADLVEETSQYGDIVSRSGQIIFGQPRRIVFRYGINDPQIMVDDRWYYEFDPGAEQLQIHAIGDSPEASMLFLGFDADATALRETFDVALFSVKNDQGSQGLTIRPRKDDPEPPSFQEVSIYLRDDDYLPYRVEIILDEDTRTVTEFRNYTINQPFEPSTSQLRIPAGTRIIEDGEVVMHSVPEGGVLMPPEPLDPVSGSETAENQPAADDTPPKPALEVQTLPAP